MIDVGTLHQHYLFLLHLASDGVTHCGVTLVAVNAFELHVLAVDEVVATSQAKLVVLGLGVLDLHLTEAHDGRYGLEHAALLVEQLGYKGVAVGSLGSPLTGSLHRQLSGSHGLAGELAHGDGCAIVNCQL